MPGRGKRKTIWLLVSERGFTLGEKQETPIAAFNGRAKARVYVEETHLAWVEYSGPLAFKWIDGKNGEQRLEIRSARPDADQDALPVMSSYVIKRLPLDPTYTLDVIPATPKPEQS